ncbi:uncharacterized protein [Zea mays]|jgi:hypothetical protein|uniref:uncharacterized protein n=1 Tax=Zea mays TaxID=4577 RepID=UPI0009A9D2DC|nr:uncharacterized protein LOC109943692 [Zea mays]|eukprot:XP_020402776.1 uncharacterized protein LOC109943692 [Zea mays]
MAPAYLQPPPALPCPWPRDAQDPTPLRTLPPWLPVPQLHGREPLLLPLAGGEQQPHLPAPFSPMGCLSSSSLSSPLFSCACAEAPPWPAPSNSSSRVFVLPLLSAACSKQGAKVSSMAADLLCPLAVPPLLPQASAFPDHISMTEQQLCSPPSFFFPCTAARSPCSQPWRPTSLRSGADPKQWPRIPSALRASPDLRSPNIDVVHLGETTTIFV